MNKNYYGVPLVVISVFALVFFVGRGVLLAGAQTQPQQAGGQNQSDFQKDVEEGEQEILNDKDAQNNQSEIDNEDDERAGDQYGDHRAIDGEKTEQEIEQEIENEVEIEGDHSDQGDEEQSSSIANPDSDVSSTSGNGGD